MKKIIIINDVSNVENPTGGPTICMKLLQNEIKNQTNDITITSSYENISNSIVWHWSPLYEIDLIEKILKNNNILICGPNSFFKGGDITNYEKYLIENKKYSYLFLHPKQYAESNYFCKYINNTKIFDIVYPVNPNCYVSNNDIDRTYDILYYKKFKCDETYKNTTDFLNQYTSNTITYGQYDINQLTYLSARSKCCIYLSCGETGGTACAEMLCNGCPIISYYGNLTYGDDGENCIKLPDNGSFIHKTDMIETYVKQCFSMNNNEILIKARSKFDIKNITANVISTLKNISK